MKPKCHECRSEKVRVLTGPRPYAAIGLPNVVVDGIRVLHCDACGEEAIEVPRLAELHRIVALTVLRKRGRLTGEEVRFLRKFIGWSASDFARRVGMDPSTVSNWETGKQPIGPAADRLLRMLVVHEQQVSDYSTEELATITDEVTPAIPVRVHASPRGWVRDRDVAAE